MKFLGPGWIRQSIPVVYSRHAPPLLVAIVRVLRSGPIIPVIAHIWSYCADLAVAEQTRAFHASAMLTEIYIEALFVDEDLADQVWEAWDKGEIDDFTAALAWWLIQA